MKAEPPSLSLAIDIAFWYQIVDLLLTGIIMLAVNIHRVEMEQPFEPVEMRPLHHISVMQVLSMIAGKPRPPQGRGSSPFSYSQLINPTKARMSTAKSAICRQRKMGTSLNFAFRVLCPKRRIAP